MSDRGGSGGRGAYYKNKYGGGRNRRGGSNQNHQDEFQPQSQTGGPDSSDGSRDWNTLQNLLQNIDGNQYGAYNRLRGKFMHQQPNFTLSVDHIQGDPYAAPSRVRAIMPWHQTGLPDEYLTSDIRKIAVGYSHEKRANAPSLKSLCAKLTNFLLCDFVTRITVGVIRTKHLDRNIDSKGGWSGPKGGAFNINSPGQEVLPRTSAMIDNNESTIELRFTASLPAAGRTILGQQAWQILGVNLVELVQRSLLHANVNQTALQQHILSVERQSTLRQQLSSRGLIAFVANGSILPRASGGAATPMDPTKAVPFRSPKEAEVTLLCPDKSHITGMGIPRGITLLTGGGFHGKSTLLEALELGIYDHIPGDGRELIVTDPSAVKIRAEDGRAVSGVDISPYISSLPGGKDTKHFSTDDASGSTSMATNIQEALEVGCKTVLIDEDSSATNLLVRDQRMQLLIKKEPITPLISKARALFNEHGVSTVIVVGGLGDWLSVTDHVIVMDEYLPRVITDEARKVVAEYPSRVLEDGNYGSIPGRKLRVDLAGVRSPMASRKGFISMRPQAKNPVDDPAEAEAGIDLAGLDQIVEVGQTRAVAKFIEHVAGETANGPLALSALLQRLRASLGIDKCLPVNLPNGDLVAVRPFELAAALARMRNISVIP